MFKPHYGTCTACDPPQVRLLVVKAGYCCQCNHRIKKEAKIARKGVSLLKKAKEKTEDKPGQMAMFLEIWEEREHVSQVSGDYLGDMPAPIFFSHILGKGAFPAFKLRKENIWLVTAKEHIEWEVGDRTQDKFKAKVAEYERLKKLYYEESRNR
jgi:hypothetical protein